MTQLERADAIRAKFMAMLPQIDALSKELSEILDDAQVMPEDGGQSDLTINEVQFNQLRQINNCAGKLVLALLFDSRQP